MLRHELRRQPLVNFETHSGRNSVNLYIIYIIVSIEGRILFFYLFLSHGQAVNDLEICFSASSDQGLSYKTLHLVISHVSQRNSLQKLALIHWRQAALYDIKFCGQILRQVIY